MDNPDLHSVSALAFGLGLLHALDADHIAAVTGLAGARAGFRDSVRFCLRWSLGHGAVLLSVGAAVLLLGMAIPDSLSALAERLVGAVLVLIGGYVLWDVLRSNSHLHFHVHDGLTRHAHWHRHAERAGTHRHGHSALLVGMLHGTAGSAPLLAVLPWSLQSRPWFGLVYLLLFGLGVLLSMLIFGGLLGCAFRGLRARGERLLRRVRVAVGLGSLGVGVWWLHGAL